MKERPILFSAEMVQAILAGRKTQTRRIIDLQRLRADVPRPITEEINGHHLGASTAGRFRIGMNPQGAVFKLGKDGSTFGLKPGEFNFVCPYAAGRTWITPKTPDRSAPWTITPDGSQRLWVRETWGLHAFGDETDWFRGSTRGVSSDSLQAQYKLALRADWGALQDGCFWRPGIFMPRWASRITLEISEVRVQRLQEINENDARAEGCKPAITTRKVYPSARAADVEIRSYCDGFAQLWDSINGKRSAWASNPWIWAITFRRVP